jgi:hypothetical protein
MARRTTRSERSRRIAPWPLRAAQQPPEPAEPDQPDPEKHEHNEDDGPDEHPS